MAWQPLWLTLKLALVTTCLLVFIGVPLASWLAFTRLRLKPVFEALISLPLVLPPSVLGFYLLLAFSPKSWPGQLLDSWFDVQLVFTFQGLVLASMLYSLPFMVQPIQSGLEGLSVSLKEASYTLGKSRLTTLFRVLLPNIKPALLTGIVLTFAHTIGEFGLVLMIGGNIAGETKVVSIAIYNEVDALRYDNARMYSLILLILSFGILLMVYMLNKRIVKTGLGR